MVLFKKFSLWLLLVVLLMSFNATSILAQEDFNVTIGQDKIFAASNVHINTIQVAPNNPSKGSPSIIEAVSEGQIASTHILAGKYQEGNAKSWNGVDFVVKASEDGKVIQEAEISITFDYSLSVDFQVPPPSEEGGGSADAIVYGILPDDPPVTVDRINFIHYSNSDARSGTKTLKKRMMLEAGKSYQVLAHVYSYGDVQIGGYADSQASVLVKEIKITFDNKPDISVSMDYKRDLKDYKTKDDKTVYGADSVIYTITVTNLGSVDATGVVVNDLLPLGLKFISADPQGVYDPTTGILNVGNLAAGASAKFNLEAKVIQSGEIINKATLNEDSNPSNNEAKITFNARNPVILVHGFNSGPDAWKTLSRTLKQEGIRHFIFDYSPGLQYPYFVAGNFNNWVNGYLKDEAYIGYQGKFDIVCHSMGALVTRFWMEGNSANAGNVGQWIGIGPVNHGAAITDIIVDPTVAPEIYNQLNLPRLINKLLKKVPPDSDAVRNMVTTDPQILDLNSDGIAPGVTYRVIMGTNVQEIPWMDTVARIGNNYQFTTAGDGIVANAQSMLIGSATTDYFSVKHTALPGNREVINRVITYLKN